jgi:hypothetical protein
MDMLHHYSAVKKKQQQIYVYNQQRHHNCINANQMLRGEDLFSNQSKYNEIMILNEAMKES